MEFSLYPYVPKNPFLGSIAWEFLTMGRVLRQLFTRLGVIKVSICPWLIMPPEIFARRLGVFDYFFAS